jgi:hypothetical protein
MLSTRIIGGNQSIKKVYKRLCKVGKRKQGNLSREGLTTISNTPSAKTTQA